MYIADPKIDFDAELGDLRFQRNDVGIVIGELSTELRQLGTRIGKLRRDRTAANDHRSAADRGRDRGREVDQRAGERRDHRHRRAARHGPSEDRDRDFRLHARDAGAAQHHQCPRPSRPGTQPLRRADVDQPYHPDLLAARRGRVRPNPGAGARHLCR